MMILVDANVILRYLLNDHKELSKKSADLLENNTVLLPTEVFCEVVYVLQKVYQISRQDIVRQLMLLFDEHIVEVEKVAVIKQALMLYAAKNMDIVDAVLYGYHIVENKEILSFDKQLNKYLNV
jgi:predicted nucleic-acid-binding protein